MRISSRLAAAAASLGFGTSPSTETVLHEIALVVRATGRRDFALRLTLFRDGASVRRLLAPSTMPVDRDAPVKLGLARPPFSDPRAIGRLKTLNYLVNRMAHADGVRRGFDEVLFLDHGGPSSREAAVRSS
jgi:branched-subunit amino acid aminotransferase/4-amino-4-deoxychorismate lyase